MFPLHSLSDQIRTFFSFVGAAPPRFYYMRDGIPMKFWDESVPDVNEVIDLRSVER